MFFHTFADFQVSSTLTCGNKNEYWLVLRQKEIETFNVDNEKFIFELHTNKNCYIFSAENSIILCDWMSVLDTVMKNMVVIQPKPTKYNLLTTQHTFGGNTRRSMKQQFSMIFNKDGF